MNKMEGGPLPNLAAVSNGAFPQMSMPLPLVLYFIFAIFKFLFK